MRLKEDIHQYTTDGLSGTPDIVINYMDVLTSMSTINQLVKENKLVLEDAEEIFIPTYPNWILPTPIYILSSDRGKNVGGVLKTPYLTKLIESYIKLIPDTECIDYKYLKLLKQAVAHTYNNYSIVTINDNNMDSCNKLLKLLRDIDDNHNDKFDHPDYHDKVGSFYPIRDDNKI